MVATFGPAKYLVDTEDTIGPRTPMHRPNVGMKSANSNADGVKVSPNRMLIPAAVPMKVAVTVWRYPKRSDRKPLPITLSADIMPSIPYAVAAAIGENPASTKKATSCTTTENIATAVPKNTWQRPQ